MARWASSWSIVPALCGKPLPCAHIAAAGGAEGPGREARPGDVPSARPGGYHCHLLGGGGAGGATGQGPRLRQLEAVSDKIIAECRTTTTTTSTTTTGDDNLVSAMLRIQQQGGLEVPFTTNNIKAVIADMFAGGTDTASSAVEWLMSELVRNPKAMAKAQAEVRQAFDNISSQDHEVHVEKLVYTKMAIKESMRLHPVLPLLVPRPISAGRPATSAGSRWRRALGLSSMRGQWKGALIIGLTQTSLDRRGSRIAPPTTRPRCSSTCRLGLVGGSALGTPLRWLCWSSLWHDFSTTSTGHFQAECGQKSLTWP